MGMNILYYVQNLWPFSAFKNDDLRISDGLVRKLSIPENTKQFVFAIPQPDSNSVIYILCAQNLSERSASDVECLIREIRPEAVIAQVGDLTVHEILQTNEDAYRKSRINGSVPTSYIEVLKRFFTNKTKKEASDTVPTSSFEVLKRCFVHKINRENYENVAGSLVLKEIFGTSFYEHFVTAKRVAEEIGSSFLLLESPILKCSDAGNSSSEAASGNKFQALSFQSNSLVPQKVGSMIPSSSKRFSPIGDLHLQILKSLSSHLVQPYSAPSAGSADIQPKTDYEPPQFAQSVYPLLVDLHNIFVDIPSIGRGLAHAQKMLDDVNRGAIVDSQLVSEVYIFRIAVEGLRIALNNAGRLPLNKIRDNTTTQTEFLDLPVEDKSHALLAHALKSQTKKCKSVLAIVDASGLSGLRKHWNNPIPPEVKDMVEQLVSDCRYDEETPNNNDKKRLLTDKPMVAVGAGATAVLGATSLSKVVPVSTFMKIVPASLKLVVLQPQKAFAMALSKTLGPSKMVAHGLASSGVKTSVLKATASAEKIRVVTHSLIASAEKTSLSAMRSAFFEIMRKRRVQPVGLLPWVTFGSSVATCSGLLVYGDGIECAVESFPAAPSIANLGRGIQNLHQAAQTAGQAESSRIQKAIESLLYKFKR